jgi:iron complex outermembrane receptor protein
VLKSGLVIAAILGTSGGQAFAQGVAQNAITQSSDAFGQQVGTERTGLYTVMEIRGLNPVDAGNVRLENLYFDQVDSLASPLLEGTRIRVGLGSQGFAFPAPSGLVDYTLSVPGSERYASLDLSLQTNLDRTATFEFELPLTHSSLSLGGGIELGDKVFPDGRKWDALEASAMLAWRPSEAVQLLGFVSTISNGDSEARPSLLPSGDFLPPRMKRGEDLSQPWADANSTTRTLGFVMRAPVGPVRLELGVFHDRKDVRTQFADLMTSVARDGSVTQRTIVADGGNLDQSLSGEARLVKAVRMGIVNSRISLSIRGRSRDRVFGGAQRIALGPSTILASDIRTVPLITLGQKSTDEVSQVFYGLAYSGSVGSRLRLDVGLSRTNYRKTVRSAASVIGIADDPMLWNASAAYDLLPGVTLFGGLIRGMEEAQVAPDRAVNRSETPPAILTRQDEIGVRYSPRPGITLLGEVFRITKPYYNLDPGLRYRLLGTTRNVGLELSLVATPVPGLTVVGGAALSRPRIIGEAVTTGLIGAHPVGEGSRRVVANVEWRPDGGRSPFSIDLGFRNESGRYISSTNSFRTPQNTVFDLGARYRFELAGLKALLRTRLQNALNSYAWNVSRSGALMYTNQRRLTVQLVTEF